MIITIDLASKQPPYVQIKQRFLHAIASGQVVAGERLPPIRQLAGDLGVATNTVARAYRDLEAEGVVAASGRRGTVVLALPDDIGGADHTDEIADTIRLARRNGMDVAQILDVVTQTLAAG